MIRRGSVVIAMVLALASQARGDGKPPTVKPNAPMVAEAPANRVARPGPIAATSAVVAPAAKPPAPTATPLPDLPIGLKKDDAWRSVQTVVLFGLISLAPAGILMLTSFVRIQIVLVLLRQALGSPQIPGNQVLTGLAILLTALVMRPVGEEVYRDSLAPLMAGTKDPKAAWEAGSRPIAGFMVAQIVRTNHQHYLTDLYDYGRARRAATPEPAYYEDYPFEVIAPAFLLSELTTAMTIGFLIYLPFLVIDLVVSAVLAAMGLFMLPPSLVALPLKMILFVLADGWLLVATRLLQTFALRAPA